VTTHHLSISEVEKFCVGSLTDDEHAAIAVHLANCSSCHQRFVHKLKIASSSGFSLDPEFWFRNDHLDFEQLIDLVENKLDEDLEQISQIHLRTCEGCSEDYRYCRTFRENTERELIGSYDRDFANNLTPQLFGLPWKPSYGIAAIVIVVVAIVTLMIHQRRETAKPQLYVHDIPIAPAAPTAPADKPVVINDARGEIAIYKDGRLTGLDELSEETRQQIAEAALSGQVEATAVLTDLLVYRKGLRGGPGPKKEVKLLYPVRRVVIEDQPVFSWKQLPEAASYQVYVLDVRGSEVVRSNVLPATKTKWRVAIHLRRGQTFSWVVAAIVDGKEIISPANSEPEMKFAVLSSTDLLELNHLKKQESHLALGVFYARTGLLSNAEREFQLLVQVNPQSELAKRLLQSVRSNR
jgi:hypothetical protein